MTKKFIYFFIFWFWSVFLKKYFLWEERVLWKLQIRWAKKFPFLMKKRKWSRFGNCTRKEKWYSFHLIYKNWVLPEKWKYKMEFMEKGDNEWFVFASHPKITKKKFSKIIYLLSLSLFRLLLLLLLLMFFWTKKSITHNCLFVLQNTHKNKFAFFWLSSFVTIAQNVFEN